MRTARSFDAITAVTQVERPEEVTAELIKEGLWKAHIPVELFGRHKYQIDIDGHTINPAGLFQKLLTGSPVLKVASPDDIASGIIIAWSLVYN